MEDGLKGGKHSEPDGVEIIDFAARKREAEMKRRRLNGGRAPFLEMEFQDSKAKLKEKLAERRKISETSVRKFVDSHLGAPLTQKNLNSLHYAVYDFAQNANYLLKQSYIPIDPKNQQLISEALERLQKLSAPKSESSDAGHVMGEEATSEALGMIKTFYDLVIKAVDEAII